MLTLLVPELTLRTAVLKGKSSLEPDEFGLTIVTWFSGVVDDRVSGGKLLKLGFPPVRCTRCSYSSIFKGDTMGERKRKCTTC